MADRSTPAYTKTRSTEALSTPGTERTKRTYGSTTKNVNLLWTLSTKLAGVGKRKLSAILDALLLLAILGLLSGLITVRQECSSYSLQDASRPSGTQLKSSCTLGLSVADLTPLNVLSGSAPK